MGIVGVLVGCSCWLFVLFFLDLGLVERLFGRLDFGVLKGLMRCDDWLSVMIGWDGFRFRLSVLMAPL